MKIDPIPDIISFPKIIDSYKDKKLVVFLGAGITSLWGCKRWKDMATSLVDSCYNLEFINYLEKDSLLYKYSSSPRKLITIAKNILGEKYINELQKTLLPDDHKRNKHSNLYEYLFSLDAMFLTTNIDQYFDELFDKKNIHVNPDNFNISDFTIKNLFHLHGIIEKPETLVMTIDEYIARYQVGRYESFLKSVFSDENLSFLFIGYGVEELEILDYIFLKYGDNSNKQKVSTNKFYILSPFFQKEEVLFKQEQSYFNKIDMTVIPYAIDETGYDQLYLVIEKWKKTLTNDKKDDNYYRNIKLMDDNL